MPPVKINGQIVELSSCLLLLSVVGLCVLPVPSARQEAGRCPVAGSERMGEREREGRRQTDGDKEREGDLREREGEREGGGRER